MGRTATVRTGIFRLDANDFAILDDDFQRTAATAVDDAGTPENLLTGIQRHLGRNRRAAEPYQPRRHTLLRRQSCADADPMQRRCCRHKAQAVPQGAGFDRHFRAVGVAVKNGKDTDQADAARQRQSRAKRDQSTQNQHRSSDA